MQLSSPGAWIAFKLMDMYHINVSPQDKGDFDKDNGTFHHWHVVHVISINK